MTEIDEKYQKFAERVIHPDAGEAQRYGMRLAFYMGALAGSDAQLGVIRANQDGGDVRGAIASLRENIVTHVQLHQNAAPDEWFPDGKH